MKIFEKIAVRGQEMALREFEAFIKAGGEVTILGEDGEDSLRLMGPNPLKTYVIKLVNDENGEVDVVPLTTH